MNFSSIIIFLSYILSFLTITLVYLILRPKKTPTTTIPLQPDPDIHKPSPSPSPSSSSPSPSSPSPYIPCNPPSKYKKDQDVRKLLINTDSNSLKNSLTKNKNKKILIILYGIGVGSFIATSKQQNKKCDLSSSNYDSTICSSENSIDIEDIIKTDNINKPYICYIIEADENGDIPNEIYLYHWYGQLGSIHDFTFKFNKDSDCTLTGDNTKEGTAFCILKNLFEKNENTYYNCFYNIVSNSVDIDGYGNLNYIIFGKYING